VETPFTLLQISELSWISAPRSPAPLSDLTSSKSRRTPSFWEDYGTPGNWIPTLLGERSHIWELTPIWGLLSFFSKQGSTFLSLAARVKGLKFLVKLESGLRSMMTMMMTMIVVKMATSYQLPVLQ
jgi:hypothetical protein